MDTGEMCLGDSVHMSYTVVDGLRAGMENAMSTLFGCCFLLYPYSIPLVPSYFFYHAYTSVRLTL